MEQLIKLQDLFRRLISEICSDLEKTRTILKNWRESLTKFKKEDLELIQKLSQSQVAYDIFELLKVKKKNIEIYFRRRNSLIQFF